MGNSFFARCYNHLTDSNEARRGGKMETVLLMSERQIRNNWQCLLRDPENPRPDIKDPDEWIALAKSGGMKALGATVVIQNELPKIKER